MVILVLIIVNNIENKKSSYVNVSLYTEIIIMEMSIFVEIYRFEILFPYLVIQFLIILNNIEKETLSYMNEEYYSEIIFIKMSIFMEI